MIKQNELRVGNWILSVSGEPFRVNAYDLVDIERFPHNPIVLTPEMLERCSFENVKGLWYEHTEFSIFLTECGGVYFGEVLNVDSPIIARIKYLHQLQNLFFALFQKELEVKEIA
ncbi:hypothetical protein [Mucilaginibacter sp.]|uniref:hypothetical protein n=1 Tax=Mucilaginibacter sp. TaxID=1882438 RepID=UPI002639E5E0|nr:hypothetical protein [Mucilaginibacter sp.]MDB5032244.1 hypothetical protein [Mucilaginibacter sp.]